MSGLVKKPRVHWDSANKHFYMRLYDMIICDTNLSRLIKYWFDNVYGKGNHGYH